MLYIALAIALLILTPGLTYAFLSSKRAKRELHTQLQMLESCGRLITIEGAIDYARVDQIDRIEEHQIQGARFYWVVLINDPHPPIPDECDFPVLTDPDGCLIYPKPKRSQIKELCSISDCELIRLSVTF